MKPIAETLLLILVCCCSVAACGAAVEPDPAEPDRPITRTVDTDVELADTKADRPGHWTIESGDFQLWLKTALEPNWSVDGTSWTARGAINKPILGFRAYDELGQPFAARMTNDREFEIEFAPHQIARVLAGDRIYFDFFPVSGLVPIVHGTARYAPRFTRWGGTKRLYVYRAINPVISGDRLRFRGRAVAKKGHELVRIFTDDDAAPAVSDEEPRHYRFDWTPQGLLLAADPPEEPVYFEVSDGAESVYRKQAGIDLRLVQIGLTTGAPFEEWPRMQCEDDTLACLEGLDDSSDTEECGYANEVEACIGTVTLPTGADEELFLRDLADEITRWYARHRHDVRALGGRTLESTLESLDPADVGRMEALEDGEVFPYDLDSYDVFYIADPIFPRSDRIWYGVYQPSGALHTMYVVN